MSKGANDFCGKELTFDRVPELDGQNEATGPQEKITIQFQGCDDASADGDYSNIVIQDSTGYFDCNGDRELHGCDYNNSELDTDLAAFLSVSARRARNVTGDGVLMVLAVRKLRVHSWRQLGRQRWPRGGR